MFVLPIDVGGTVYWDAPVRPDTGPTVQVIDRDGSIKVAALTAATLSSFDQTLSEGVARGAKELRVASTSGLATGDSLVISGQGAPSERVVVKDFSTAQIRLRWPCAYSHPVSADVESTRISYTVAAGVADVARDHWQAIFSWARGSTTQPPMTIEFAVSRRYSGNPITPSSMLRIEPQLLSLVASDTDLGDIADRAWRELCDRLTGRGIPWYDYLESGRLEIPGAYMGLLLCAESYGARFQEQRNKLYDRVDKLMRELASVTPVDEDRDGKISSHETRGLTGFRIKRTG